MDLAVGAALGLAYRRLPGRAHFALVKGNHLIKRTFEIVTLTIGLKLILG
jgi:hypothetical protein